VGPELALGFPAAGALAASALRERRPVAYAAGALLGLCGLAAALVPLPAGLAGRFRLDLGAPSGAARLLLAASAMSLAIIVLLAPRRVDRLALMVAGLAGLAGLAALAFAPDAAFLALALLGLGVGHSSLPGLRPLSARLHGPGLAAVLLAVGYALTLGSQSPGAARLAALALALGLVAALGLLPFVQRLDPAEPVPASAIVWQGFFGPVLAIGFTERVAGSLDASAGAIYASVLIGLGLVNVIWGGLGAWWVIDDVAAWRYSFLAEWGLALCGLGLLGREARQSAFLLLLSILLVRLPLYLWARPVMLGREAAARGPLNVVLIFLLAGVAPFAGFGARLLLLNAATQVAWPLAAVLAVSMLIWVGHCTRLARTMGRPRGRAAIGVWAAVAFSLLIGLVPGPLLAVAGL
jgi:hypothetical protein